jgi:hypothetical protein
MTWKRTISRALFLALLAAIGYAVHLLLPPAPRWRLQGPLEILGLTADGRHFWTIALKPIDDFNGGRRGPLQLRDLGNGAVVAEYMTSEPGLFGCVMSKSGRFVVAYDNNANCLHVIDSEGDVENLVQLDAGVKVRLDNFMRGGVIPDDNCAFFAPNEKYFQFTERGGGSWTCLIETATGKIKKPFSVPASIRAYLADGSFACLPNKDASGFFLWNLETDQEESHRLGPFTHWYYVSPNSRFLVSYADRTLSEAAIWDSTNWQRKTVHNFDAVTFSPASRWMICRDRLDNLEEERVSILDPVTGKLVGTHQIEGLSLHHAFSGDDSRYLVTTKSKSGKLSLEMLQLPEGKRVWIKPLDSKADSPSYQFTADGSVMMALDTAIIVLDGETGAEKFIVLNDFSGWSDPILTKDRKFAHCAGLRTNATGWWDEWIAKWLPWLLRRGIVFVANAESGRLLLGVPYDAQNDVKIWLTEDGESLVVSQTDREEGRVYDHRAYAVPVRPRWAWIVGVPAGLGGLVLGWRRWRNRKRQPATAAN